MNRNLRIGLGIVAIVGALFVTLGESSSGGEQGSNGESGGAEEASKPTSSAQEPLPVGTSVEVAEGWVVTVNSAQLDATAAVVEANQFNAPDPGSQFVLVDVTVENKSDEPAAPFTNLTLSLLPPSGVAITPTFIAGVPGELDSAAQMQPGASATGTVPFEVPSADVPATVMLAEPLFTLDEVEDQVFLAIQ